MFFSLNKADTYVYQEDSDATLDWDDYICVTRQLNEMWLRRKEVVVLYNLLKKAFVYKKDRIMNCYCQGKVLEKCIFYFTYFDDNWFNYFDPYFKDGISLTKPETKKLYMYIKNYLKK